MFIVQYQYFDVKGNQKSKRVDSNTLKGLISKMDNHLKTVELYEISHVSENLIDYDFKQNGEHFKGWSK